MNTGVWATVSSLGYLRNPHGAFVSIVDFHFFPVIFPFQVFCWVGLAGVFCLLYLCRKMLLIMFLPALFCNSHSSFVVFCTKILPPKLLVLELQMEIAEFCALSTLSLELSSGCLCWILWGCQVNYLEGTLL